jgi:RNA polymerase sigma-70 factor (ECF subfamily)
LAALQGSGARQHAALEDLRDYLLRAVYVYLSRHRSDLVHLDRSEVEQLAEDYVQEALVLVLSKLDTFRGDSKLTTWAYRVAINLAAGDLRRRQWRDMSLDALNEAVEEELPPLSAMMEDTSMSDPDQEVMRRQIWELIRQAIQEELTERQRIVFINQYFRGVSPEVIAERLGTNRNNVYKIAHDARVKLKKHLAAQGLTEDEILAAFQDHTATALVSDGLAL